MKMNRKFLVLASLFILAAILVTGCVPKGGDTPKNDAPAASDTPTAGTDAPAAAPKILKTNNGSEPGSLDPALAQGTHESWVLDHTFEGLMKLDEDGMVVEGMAKEYKVSDDYLTYT
ncbi:MAG: peptide ABC transporter substrate-binding protein, partial [Tissierellaceae bacterium]